MACISKVLCLISIFAIRITVEGQFMIRPVILDATAGDFETLGPLPGFPTTEEVPLSSGGPPIFCAAQNFISLNSCCNKSKEIFFPDRLMWQCNGRRENKFHKNYAREYVLNKLQLAARNSINLRAANIQTVLGSAMCFMECLFKSKKLLFKTKTIDYDTLMTKFVAAVPQTPQLAMEEIINTCRMNIEIFTKTKIKAPAKSCLTKPLFLMQCIRKNLLLNCPIGMEVNSTLCTNGRIKMKLCELF